MSIKWNQVALAAAAGFLLGAVFSDFYRMHRMPGPPHHGMGGPMEMFSRELDLSSGQKEQLKNIFEKYQPEMDKAMEANRPAMDAVRLHLKAEINAVLTPEQQKKMEKLESRFEPPHGGRGGPPMGHGPAGDR
jgi:Spy/CpxP family protein refolding chaperone